MSPKTPHPEQASLFEPQITNSMYGDGEPKYTGERLLADDEQFKPAKALKAGKKVVMSELHLPEAAVVTPLRTDLLERNAQLQSIFTTLGVLARNAGAWRAVDAGGSIVDTNTYNMMMRRPRIDHDVLTRMSKRHDQESQRLPAMFSEMWGLEKLGGIDDTPKQNLQGDEQVWFNPWFEQYQDRENFFNKFSQSAMTTNGQYREVSTQEAAKNRENYKRKLVKQEKALRKVIVPAPDSQ